MQVLTCNYFIEKLTEFEDDSIIWYGKVDTIDKSILFGKRSKYVKTVGKNQVLKFLSVIYLERLKNRKTIFQGVLPLEIRKQYLLKEWHIDIEKEESEEIQIDLQ